MCASFIHFKVLLAETLDACKALGETSVLNGMILLVLARLFNMRCLSSRSRRPRKKSTRLPPQSVLWTHWAAMAILVLFF